MAGATLEGAAYPDGSSKVAGNVATPPHPSKAYLPSPISLSPSHLVPTQSKPRRISANLQPSPIPPVHTPLPYYQTPSSLGHSRSASNGINYPPSFAREVDWSRISRDAPTPYSGPYIPGQYRSHCPPSSTRTTQGPDCLYESDNVQQASGYVAPNTRTLTNW